ncbi:MAG: flagellar basal body P-ring formation protein FlgA [Pseudomonadota bacterium]|nr:flagellar basal body P-ring formation protein FlgA [Pseudomonadota bacterium]
MKTLLLACLTAIALPAIAQTATPRQDPAQIREVVEQFLQTQSIGLPGETRVTVGQLDAHLNLPACAAPEAFLPSGAKASGKTSVGVRCGMPTPWTVYVTAQVKVLAQYLVSAAPLSQGQQVGPNDVVKMKGDLSTLPAGVITDPAQAIGRTVAQSIGMGVPLRQDSLKLQQAVLQGQAVRLVSNGSGFSVTTEGRALNNAAAGQVAQARTAGGQVVSGVARAGGIVEVTF